MKRKAYVSIKIETIELTDESVLTLSRDNDGSWDESWEGIL